MNTRLRTHRLTYETSGKRLLQDVDLDCRAGEILAVAGPNGAGKSTLLRLLSGELTPTRGSVELDGRPLARITTTQRARLRAVMPQETALGFAFTVREIVHMGRYPHPPGRDHEVVEAALRASELQPLAAQTFPTLSGGERGRTTLARVLAQETEILLLDEPSAALDIRHQERVMETVRELANAGSTIVAALHDLNLAAAYADRIALLHNGRLVARGSPRHVLSEALLSAVFDHPITVTPNPVDGSLLVAPARPHRPDLRTRQPTQSCSQLKDIEAEG